MIQDDIVDEFVPCKDRGNFIETSLSNLEPAGYLNKNVKQV